MKQKYTITLLDLPVSVVSDEDEETVNALAKELNEKLQAALWKSRQVSKTEAALFCALDAFSEAKTLAEQLKRAEAQLELYTANLARMKEENDKLTARVDALLRRAGDAPLVSAAVGEISQPPFLLNMTDRVVEKNGKRLKLTQLEYQIMKLFMENPDKALTREEILDTVWGRGYFGEVKIVDVNIRRLRLKIEDDAQEPRYIATVWGTGYKWSTD